MKTLLKKWDLWYWLAYILYLFITASTSPYLGQTGIFGTTTVGSSMFWIGVLSILPAVFIYVVIRSIKSIVIRIKTGQDKTKYIVLLIVVIGMSLWIGYTLWRLFLG